MHLYGIVVLDIHLEQVDCCTALHLQATKPCMIAVFTIVVKQQDLCITDYDACTASIACYTGGTCQFNTLYLPTAELSSLLTKT